MVSISSSCFTAFFFISLARSKYLSLFSFFTLRSAVKAKSTRRQVFWLGWLIRLYPQIPENLMRVILKEGFWFVHIPFGIFHFLALFSVDHFPNPVMSALFLLSFYICLQCEIVSSLSPKSILVSMLEILALIILVLKALFWTAIRRDSVFFFFFSFPFRSYVQVFSCEFSPFCLLKYPYSGFSFHFCLLIFVVAVVLFVLFVNTVTIVGNSAQNNAMCISEEIHFLS